MSAVRRAAPTDRRTPVRLVAGGCPLGQGCYCCPDIARHSQRTACRQQHPAAERLCSPPYPARIPPCPERAFLPIDPPTGLVPRWVVCDDCGRITARRWTSPDGRQVAWCNGEFPTLPETEPTR